MTQHTLKVNIAFPVSSQLALSHDKGFLISCIPQKSRLSQCHEGLLKQTSCEVNSSKCLVCGQLICQLVLSLDYYLCINTQGLQRPWCLLIPIFMSQNSKSFKATQASFTYFTTFSEDTHHLPKDPVTFCFLQKTLTVNTTLWDGIH